MSAKVPGHVTYDSIGGKGGGQRAPSMPTPAQQYAQVFYYLIHDKTRQSKLNIFKIIEMCDEKKISCHLIFFYIIIYL